MKKVYLLSAIAFFALASCQQNAKAAPETEDYTMEDTTAMPENDGTATDMDAATDTTMASGAAEGGKVKLPDTISVKTIRPKVDTSNKFALANTKWRLTELNGKAPKNDTGKDFTLVLNSKTGKITGFAGCNNIMGSYLMKEDGKLNFLYVGSTKMACPEMKAEEKFMAMLPKVDSYMIEGNMLHLHKGNGKALAKFEAIP